MRDFAYVEGVSARSQRHAPTPTARLFAYPWHPSLCLCDVPGQHCFPYFPFMPQRRHLSSSTLRWGRWSSTTSGGGWGESLDVPVLHSVLLECEARNDCLHRADLPNPTPQTTNHKPKTPTNPKTPNLRNSRASLCPSMFMCV